MIPKIIHQVYVKQKPDSVFPKEYERCQKTVWEHHPDFQYKLYDENDMENVIKKHCPEYLEVWNNLPRMIMKIDMFRIMLMYVFGGIWADFDYFFFKPFDLLDHKIVLTCNKENEQGQPISVANALMASQPNQPFWKKLLDNFFAQNRTIRYQSEWDVIRETGPQFLSKTWKEYLPKEDIYVAERKLFHPPSLNSTYNYKYIEELRTSGIYGIHFCTSLWFHGKNYL
tara:strand:+ start:3472 stop:4152 length:681 start_codon:yes stop_codon:yes gene_type:complete